ncbi:hypothetical protein PHYSODRAFT_335588 [Phytophthora sojae]|uniref:Uncharacterized protein n=1 Tax=Phytophthora sojae (strain P6497) TaxID=1094619 RepID=G4ZQT2_PHYSP|nr:hypothetical protein PHYSODRAFT_335588 [Phytophthora sojae]EGZ13880.1 hypothetical protein PHYSODRAFT_335588 [Phytophthora sojae]|eukprot:XP_009531309.1 hypothetical protein PHYSODRAFT_335588 [Phytophthora sojae]
MSPRTATQLVIQSRLPLANGSLPHVVQLIDGFLAPSCWQAAFNAACEGGASERMLEFFLLRATPDWDEVADAAAKGGHSHVVRWVTSRVEGLDAWETYFSRSFVVQTGDYRAGFGVYRRTNHAMNGTLDINVHRIESLSADPVLVQNKHAVCFSVGRSKCVMSFKTLNTPLDETLAVYVKNAPGNSMVNVKLLLEEGGLLLSSALTIVAIEIPLIYFLKNPRDNRLAFTLVSEGRILNTMVLHYRVSWATMDAMVTVEEKSGLFEFVAGGVEMVTAVCNMLSRAATAVQRFVLSLLPGNST